MLFVREFYSVVKEIIHFNLYFNVCSGGFSVMTLRNVAGRNIALINYCCAVLFLVKYKGG